MSYPKHKWRERGYAPYIETIWIKPPFLFHQRPAPPDRIGHWYRNGSIIIFWSLFKLLFLFSVGSASVSLSPFVVDQYNCRVKDPSSAGTPPCSCGSLEPPPYHRESSASREREGSTVQEKSIVRERSAHRRRWGERFKSQGGLSS